MSPSGRELGLTSEAPRSLVHPLLAATRDAPASLALSCLERRLDYGELGAAVAGLAQRLRRELGRDLQPGARVAVALPTGIEAVVAAFAVLSLRAQLVLVNPYFSRAELGAVLGEARPRLLVVGDDARDALIEAARDAQLQTLELSAKGRDVEALIANDRASLSETSLPGPDDPALLVFTGGTTGTPKAVDHDHRSLTVSLLLHQSAWPVELGGERFLSAAPVFHVWGFSYATCVPIFRRGALFMLPKLDASEALRLIEAERIGVFGGGPAPVYLSLMRHPRFSRTDFSSLRYCLSGGAPCPSELSRAWQRATGCALLEGYGMSEAAPICLNPASGPNKPLSVGPPVPDTRVEIVDLERGDRCLGPGEPGEVRVRGPQLMKGYFESPAATRDAIRDGYLYTGDIGYLDDDGYLFLVDRKKDMILVGGYNVYPRTVDEVLFSHPEIAEAACVGVPHDELGEALVAFVVPIEGAALSEAAVLEHCRRELVKYRRPVAVHFESELPRTGARKLDKKRLRERARQLRS